MHGVRKGVMAKLICGCGAVLRICVTVCHARWIPVHLRICVLITSQLTMDAACGSSCVDSSGVYLMRL
jgi:hypothetical protein